MLKEVLELTDSITTLGIGTWGHKSTDKPSKAFLIQQICSISGTKSLDISTLTIKDIKSILKTVREITNINLEMPTGTRLKLPYLNSLSEVFPTVALNKLSISSLRELIGVVNTCSK